MPAPRQTQSYLRELFARRGIAPRHRYGQNFLIDLNLHDVIAIRAEVVPGDLILEIGPGAGALTAMMAEMGGTVVAVDIDPGMVGLTTDATAQYPGVRVIHADALKGKNRLNPVVVDHLRSAVAAMPDRPFKLVANLPYSIATPLVSNLLVHPEFDIKLMVVTIQLELAERMQAAPHSEHYSALSVTLQAQADIEIVRVLPPSVFWPRPKVESAIVAITPDPVKRAAIGDLPWFHSVVRKIFLHRRKNLRRVIYSLWRDQWEKSEVDDMLQSIGLTGEIRAESMNVDEFVALAEVMKSRLRPVKEIIELDDESEDEESEEPAGEDEDDADNDDEGNDEE